MTARSGKEALRHELAARGIAWPPPPGTPSQAADSAAWLVAAIGAGRLPTAERMRDAARAAVLDGAASTGQRRPGRPVRVTRDAVHLALDRGGDLAVAVSRVLPTVRLDRRGFVSRGRRLVPLGVVVVTGTVASARAASQLTAFARASGAQVVALVGEALRPLLVSETAAAWASHLGALESFAAIVGPDIATLRDLERWREGAAASGSSPVRIVAIEAPVTPDPGAWRDYVARVLAAGAPEISR